MALLKPLWMEAAPGDTAIQYSAAQERAALLGAVFSREGVLDKDAGHLRVTQRTAGANFSVDVAAGRCAIVGDDTSDQGTYVCISTTAINIAIPAPPASGSRVHRVIARIRDKLANGTWTVYDWTIELLTDTGSGTPALPNSAITLALVTVAAATVSVTTVGNISDQRGRAIVGTPALAGDMIASGIHASYGGRDSSRPPSWSKTADGWVMLSGWIYRSGVATGNLVVNTTYWFDGVNNADPNAHSPMLPAEARPTGVRDMISLTSAGYVHIAAYPSGALSFRFNYVVNITTGTWFTFDSVAFRAVSF